jgi:hypothetical protein
MRKLLLSILIIFISSTFGYSKNNKTRDFEYFPRNEIYVQYGTPTILELVTTINQKDRGTTSNQKFSGVGAAGYNFSISDKFAVGIYGGVSYTSADIAPSIGGVSTSTPLFKSSVMSYVGMLSASWTYFNQNAMTLSSSLYLGVNYRDETISLISSDYKAPIQEDLFRFAYHITAIKFRYGEAIGGFAELGFGYRGIVNVGLSILL